MSPRRKTQTAITEADVEVAITARLEALQKPGGALYDLVAEAKAAALVAAAQRGRNQVWAILRTAAGAVALTLLGWFLTNNADKRDEAAAHREKARAEVVDQKLKVVEDVAKALVPPESMSSFKVGK